MNKPKIRTAFNAAPYKGKAFTQKSKTVPDQSLTVRELLQRYASGLPLDGAKVAHYESAEYEEAERNYFPDPKTLDYSEIQQYQKAVAAQSRDLQTKLQELQRKRSTDARTAKINEIKGLLKELEVPVKPVPETPKE